MNAVQRDLLVAVVRLLVYLYFLPGMRRKFLVRVLQRLFADSSVSGAFPRASVEWLIQAEIRYGGIQTGVPRNRISPHDPRTDETLSSIRMQGGDRMLHHAYAKKYAEYLVGLRPFQQTGLVIAEFGILRGTGLAIWCDLFPHARVIGFDIDLSHFRSNFSNLKARGAFADNVPEVFPFDQFFNNENYLAEILNGDKIALAIDDGIHMDNAILTTFESVFDHMADEFVYFIEDNASVHRALRVAFPSLCIKSFGQLTVLRPASNSQ